MSFADDLKNIRETQRQAVVFYQENGASDLEVAEVTREYRLQILSMVQQERKVRKFLNQIMDYLGKNGCGETERKLRQLFIEGASGLPDLYGEMLAAENNLIDLYGRDAAHKDPSFYRLRGQLLSLEKHLTKVQEIMRQPETLRFYKILAEQDEEAPDGGHIQRNERFIKEVINRQQLIKQFLQSGKAKGRPSIKGLTDFVYILAKTYSEFSGNRFSVYRRTDAGNNEPITNGHKFVSAVIAWLQTEGALLQNNTLFFTDSNIYNACEKAQIRIKSS